MDVCEKNSLMFYLLFPRLKTFPCRENVPTVYLYSSRCRKYCTLLFISHEDMVDIETAGYDQIWTIDASGLHVLHCE